MTTHEVGAFIHVNGNASKSETCTHAHTTHTHARIEYCILHHSGDHSRGTLYISDSTGEYYTVSLEKHLVSVTCSHYL